jgi:HK97 family phage portal protein
MGSFGVPSIGPMAVDTSGALKIDIVYSVIKVISESFAALPVKIYSRKGEKITIERDHDQYDLLKSNPSRLYTAYSFKRSMATNLMIFGNAYAKIIRNENGRPISYRILDSKNTMPFLVKFDNGEEDLWFKEWDTDEIIKGADMIHWADLSSDPCFGVSRISNHAELLGMSRASLEYRNKLYANGLKISGTVSYPKEANIGNDQLRELRASFQAIYGGVQDGTKVAFLNDGGKFEPVSSSMNFADLQHIQSEQFTRESILALFLVPAGKLGMGDSKYNNLESMLTDFDKNVMTPLCVSWEQEHNRKVFRPSEKKTHYVKCLIDAISRADIDTKSQYYDRAIKGGQMTINEVRSKQDLNPVDGGDEIYIPVNNVFPMSQMETYIESFINKKTTNG